ncbi:uncharacterized protein LOC120423015 [Culex pipiens pallens]|uniref:uncharacterized protein LOC120423015 n=1 Tax=Culex pipiens pallens TaxID=42434 RepID=UPI001952D1EF|nr:uncharacterized protein LOC120423015 [Culex pipiens pallens]
MNPADYHDQIPRRLLDQILYAEKITIRRGVAPVFALITQDHQLIEVRQRSIQATIDLAELLTSAGTTTLPSIFGSYSPEPDDDGRKGKVSLTVFRSNDGVGRRLFYLVEIERHLVVVERQGEPSVKFVHNQTFEGFIQLSITENEERPGHEVVKIYQEQSVEPTVMDFQSFRVVPSDLSVNNFTCFHEILKSLRDRSAEKCAELAMIRETTAKLYARLNQQLKQVPGLLRTENPDEKRPLVKYGDIWTKVHNERLVVGIPVFNCTYKRRLTLTNLQLLLVNGSNQRFEYSYRVYQLSDDDFNFKNYEQILEIDDEVPEVPQFNQEWKPLETNALHSEQTAVLVATIKLSTLSELSLTTNLECFVTYDVATVESDFCNPLQLYPGAVDVKRTDLFRTNSGVTFHDRHIFKDLLVVTATSEFIPLVVSFEQSPNRGLDRFCMEALNFKVLNLSNSIEERELPTILYFADNGYWQSTMIRLDQPTELKQKLKIYCRYSHQIVTLLQTIYSDYEEKCRISLMDEHNSTAMEFKDSLLKEIDTKIERPTNEQDVFQREFVTDCAFASLNER